MPTLKTFTQDGWRGVVSPDFALPDALSQWAEALLVQASIRYNSRAIIPFTDASGAHYYVKLLFGASEKLYALPQVLKWCLRPSRALRVAMVSRAMLDVGIDCAEVVLAARRRAWQPLGWPTDIIITRQANGVSLRDIVIRGDQSEITQAVKLAGKAVAQLHRAGFVHGDCQPGNLFVQFDTARVAFIDNDRTARSCALWRTHQEARNLIQLGFGLLRRQHFTPALWQTLVSEYAAVRGCALPPLLKRITGRIEKRLRLGR